MLFSRSEWPHEIVAMGERTKEARLCMEIKGAPGQKRQFFFQLYQIECVCGPM